jgi:hypothetical protein
LIRTLLLALLVLAAPPVAQAQESPFVGEWVMSWDGPDPNDKCPCTGSLVITTDSYGNGYPLTGEWSGPKRNGVLRGTVNLDQNFWGGNWTMDDDGSGYIKKGFFRLELRGRNTLTGSYRLDGSAISYSWSGKRK